MKTIGELRQRIVDTYGQLAGLDRIVTQTIDTCAVELALAGQFQELLSQSSLTMSADPDFGFLTGVVNAAYVTGLEWNGVGVRRVPFPELRLYWVLHPSGEPFVYGVQSTGDGRWKVGVDGDKTDGYTVWYIPKGFTLSSDDEVRDEVWDTLYEMAIQKLAVVVKDLDRLQALQRQGGQAR